MSKSHPNQENLKSENCKVEASTCCAEAQEKTKAMLAEKEDRYLRLRAEFDNYKRRSESSFQQLINSANSALIQSLLPVLDDFERALSTVKMDEATTSASQQGIQLIYNKLLHTLENVGLSRMKVDKGIAFDPERHEAVQRTQATDNATKGTILEVVERGYLLNGRIIRFPKVIISA